MIELSSLFDIFINVVIYCYKRFRGCNKISSKFWYVVLLVFFDPLVAQRRNIIKHMNTWKLSSSPIKCAHYFDQRGTEHNFYLLGISRTYFIAQYIIYLIRCSVFTGEECVFHFCQRECSVYVCWSIWL